MGFRKRITTMKKCAFRQQIYNKGLKQNIHHLLTFAALGPRDPVLVHWVWRAKRFHWIVFKTKVKFKYSEVI